jgi:hypothetical protein
VVSINDNGDEILEPVRIFGIIRMFNPENNQEQILLVAAYLEKCRLSQIALKDTPEDNIYMYLYNRGNLWLDLITVSRVRTPLILRHVCDSFPVIDTLRLAKEHRFAIQRPFFPDSTKADSNSVSQFNNLVSNLFRIVPLPNSLELQIFNALVHNSNIQHNDEVEIDLFEH